MVELDASHARNKIFAGIYWLLALLFFFGSGLLWFDYRLLGGLSLLAVLTLAYAGFVEPYFITVKTYRLPLVAQPTAWLRVAFLSDLHAGAYKHRWFYDRAVAVVRRLRPDVIVIGGDAVEEHHQAMRDLERFAELAAPLGNYFVLGNHDFLDDPEMVRQQWLAWGYQELTNRSVLIKKDQATLHLIGVDDIWNGQPDVSWLRQAGQRKPNIVFMHQPDGLIDLEPQQADLILAGHAHGGQLRLPFFGAFGPLPQRLPRQYDRGLKLWQGTPVIISQGLGETVVRTRLFCPPQIVMIEAGI